MYYPYLRGKQNELLLLRENAELIAESNVIPIIEPVKKSLSTLKKALTVLIENSTYFILIINPKVGEFAANANEMDKLKDEIFNGMLAEHTGYSIGYILDGNTTPDEVSSFIDSQTNSTIAFIHSGYSKAKTIADNINSAPNIFGNIFIENESGDLYRSYFTNHAKVIVMDSFKKQKNSGYPYVELFSDIHLTFEMKNMTGFGDFLIMANDYQETGGPAYAVTIHLTYLDSEEDNQAFVFHFISDRTETPADPAGKFLEALNKLITEIDSNSEVYESTACTEFRKLHANQHYPGLGYVKKISMQHHVELMADFLKSPDDILA